VRYGREYLVGFLLRCVVWVLMHVVYRLTKVGVENIPKRGPGVIVCNHVSFLDALVITAACPRPIRWVMDHRIYRTPVMSWLFKLLRAIPIAPEREDRETLERAYDRIARALDKGELVGIFPEGRLTNTGDILEFRGGVMRILERYPVYVVPMALSGLWRSLFARNPEKYRWWTRIWPRVRVVVGEPVPPLGVTPQMLHTIVAGLRGAWR